MAKIHVNCAAIEAAAGSIDRCVDAHRRSMQKMETELVQLGALWRGSDYQYALVQWRELNSGLSACECLIRDLEKQAELLRWSAQRYATVQSAAISRAKRLR